MSISATPKLALSIRQPYCWLILHAGKDIENRDWPTKFRGRVLIHASKTYGKRDYADDWETYDMRFGQPYPEREAMIGGIVGSVEIVDCVRDSDSPWYTGAWGFVLRDPQVLPFRPYKGQLGFFPVPPLEAPANNPEI